MLGPILVFLLIVVISAVIGAVSQVLKNAAKQPLPKPRPRAGGGARPASGDIDRFLEEIDRLRKKKAGEDSGEPDRSSPPVAKPVARPARPQPTAKAVPTVESRRSKRRAEPVAEAKPVPKSRRVEQLPQAAPVSESAASSEPRVTAPLHLAALPKVTSGPVVTAPLQLAALPKVTSGPVVTASPRQQPKTDFDRRLRGLLTSQNGLPLALVLTEILGPPKCRRG